MRSGLIAGQDSASIGKTYRAISKTFEHYNDLEAFPRCHFSEPPGGGRLLQEIRFDRSEFEQSPRRLHRFNLRGSNLRSLREGVLQGRGTRARTGEVQLVNLQGCT